MNKLSTPNELSPDGLKEIEKLTNEFNKLEHSKEIAEAYLRRWG
jgi:hypothetical protein